MKALCHGVLLSVNHGSVNHWRSVFRGYTMVFKTLALSVRNRGPDEFWKKRRILKLSAVRSYMHIYC